MCLENQEHFILGKWDAQQWTQYLRTHKSTLLCVLYTFTLTSNSVFVGWIAGIHRVCICIQSSTLDSKEFVQLCSGEDSG